MKEIKVKNATVRILKDNDVTVSEKISHEGDLTDSSSPIVASTKSNEMVRGDASGGDCSAVRTGEGDASGGNCSAVRTGEGDASGGNCSAVRTDEGDATGGNCSAVRTGEGDATGGYGSAVRTHEGDASGGNWSAVRTDDGDATGGNCSAVRTGEGDATVGNNGVAMGTKVRVGKNSVGVVLDDNRRIIKVLINVNDSDHIDVQVKSEDQAELE